MNFLEPVHELRDFMIFRIARHQKGSGGTIKNLIPSLQGILIILIILLKTSDQAGLGAQPSKNFKVIVDEGPRVFR